MAEQHFRYWDEGAAVIRDLGGPYEYGCPLCVRLFPRDQIQHLSPDHVPPRSVGGKLEVLTCNECNHTAGAELDSHAAGVERFRRVVAGEAYPRVEARFKFDDVTATMELRADRARSVEILGLPKANRPGVLEKVTAVFDDHVRAGTTPSIEFTMPKLRCSEQRARVSYLRAGYLAAFAVFGYTAITSQSFDPVRQQIREPDVEHLRFFFHHRRDDLHGYWVAVVEEPSWHVSIVVLMGKFQITLPLPGDAGLYARIAEKAAVGVQLSLECRRFDWPKRPLYLRDRHLARSAGLFLGSTADGPAHFGTARRSRCPTGQPRPIARGGFCTAFRLAGVGVETVGGFLPPQPTLCTPPRSASRADHHQPVHGCLAVAVHIYSDNPSEVTGATLNGGHPLSQGRRAAGVTGGPDGGLAAIVAEIPTAGTISGGTVTRNPTNPVNAVRLTFRLLLRGKPV